MRRRYAMREVNGELKCVEVGGDYTGQLRTGGHKSEEEVYGNLQATDGTPINTRKRQREYMKATGLAHTEDYKESWAKARQQRDDLFTGNYHNPRIRESIERAVYQLTEGRRRK